MAIGTFHPDHDLWIEILACLHFHLTDSCGGHATHSPSEFRIQEIELKGAGAAEAGESVRIIARISIDAIGSAQGGHGGFP